MIDKLSYEELKNIANLLDRSSKSIREIANKYSNELDKVSEFCSSIDSYVNFIESSIKLYQDSEIALESIKRKCQ